MARVVFTDEDKAKIKAQHDNGMSYAAIAAIYGVAPITINRICKPELAERQRKATAAYEKKIRAKKTERQKKNFRRFTLQFHNVNDGKLLAHLDKKENVTGYIRDLILTDMDQKETSE